MNPTAVHLQHQHTHKSLCSRCLPKCENRIWRCRAWKGTFWMHVHVVFPAEKTVWLKIWPYNLENNQARDRSRLGCLWFGHPFEFSGYRFHANKDYRRDGVADRCIFLLRSLVKIGAKHRSIQNDLSPILRQCNLHIHDYNQFQKNWTVLGICEMRILFAGSCCCA